MSCFVRKLIRIGSAERGVLRRIFEPKTDEGTGKLRQYFIKRSLITCTFH